MSSSSKTTVIADIRCLQGGNRDRGIGRYTINFLVELLSRESIQLVCLFDPNLSTLDTSPEVQNISHTSPEIEEFVLRNQTNPYVYLMMSPFEWGINGDLVLPQWVSKLRIPVAAIGYDLIPLLFEDIYLKDRGHKYRYRARLRLLETVDAIWAISESSRRDFEQHLVLKNCDIISIGTGVLKSAFPKTASSPTKSNSLSIVLCVSGDEPRKNTERLLHAWSQLPLEIRKSHQLVVVCRLSEATRHRWADLANEYGLSSDEYVFTGEISDAELGDYYRSCKLVVAPYIYEGFGLPVAEAVMFHKPVVCSNTSSLPEILDYPEATFDPMSVVSIAACLEKFLSNEAALNNLINRSVHRSQFFNWSSVVDRAMQSLLRIRQQITPPATPTSPTLVCLSATVPSLSGVAIYSHHLLSEMKKKVDLLHLIDDIPTNLAHLIPGEKRYFPDVRRPSAYGAQVLANRRMNARYLSILGNSPYHIASFEFAMKNRGAVWLHDMTVLDLVISRLSELSRPLQRRYVDQLFDNYERINRKFERPNRKYLTERDWYLENQITFIELVVNNAEKVIVNSKLAASIIYDMSLPRQPSVKVLPLAFEEPSCYAEKAHEPTIVTLGWVSMVKRPMELIQMLTLLQTKPKLVFAGPIDKGLRDDLAEFAESLAVSEQVLFTGALSTDDYWRWCHRAWVGIQLRANNHGESSATVRDFMAAKTPVITEVASAADTPHDAIEYLSADFDLTELSNRVSKLIADASLRQDIGNNGYLYVSSNTFERISREVIDFLMT